MQSKLWDINSQTLLRMSTKYPKTCQYKHTRQEHSSLQHCRGKHKHFLHWMSSLSRTLCHPTFCHTSSYNILIALVCLKALSHWLLLDRRKVIISKQICLLTTLPAPYKTNNIWLLINATGMTLCSGGTAHHTIVVRCEKSYLTCQLHCFKHHSCCTNGFISQNIVSQAKNLTQQNSCFLCQCF